MKKLILLILLLGSSVGFADSGPLLLQPGKVVAQPALRQPLGPEWKAPHGSWQVREGEIVAAENPADTHAAVLWHLVPVQDAIIECEFLFDGAGVFIIGCDSASRHIGRVVVTPAVVRISEDASEIKGKQPGKTLAEQPLKLKKGEWYPVRIEWTGDQMAARVAGAELRGAHPALKMARERWWFAVGGASVRIRSIRVLEGTKKPE